MVSNLFFGLFGLISLVVGAAFWILVFYAFWTITRSIKNIEIGVYEIAKALKERGQGVGIRD
jgi:hypothetical protein